jgi:hypothetical protein
MFLFAFAKLLSLELCQNKTISSKFTSLNFLLGFFREKKSKNFNKDDQKTITP